MSTHPNTILLCILTPDDTTRKTYRAILADENVEADEDIKLGEQHFGENYSIRVMESDYDENSQISASEGDIIVWTFVTYGYGEQVAWDKLVGFRDALVQWAEKVCAKHACKYKISVTSNYW